MAEALVFAGVNPLSTGETWRVMRAYFTDVAQKRVGRARAGEGSPVPSGLIQGGVCALKAGASPVVLATARPHLCHRN